MHTVLNSTWQQVSAVENGRPIDTHDRIVLVFSNGHFFVMRDGALEIQGTFEINTDMTEIDWHDTNGQDAGKTFKAICQFEEDLFAFCAADEGLARPAEFSEHQGYTVRRFRREK